MRKEEHFVLVIICFRYICYLIDGESGNFDHFLIIGHSIFMSSIVLYIVVHGPAVHMVPLFLELLVVYLVMYDV